MNFKESYEKDPARCRVLRRNKEEIKRQQDTANASFSSAMNRIKNLRDERGRLKDREKNLVIAIAGTTAASGLRGPIGHVLGGSSNALSTQLEVLRSSISALEAQISQVEVEIGRLKSHRSRWETSIKQNADELGALNCVI